MPGFYKVCLSLLQLIISSVIERFKIWVFPFYAHSKKKSEQFRKGKEENRYSQILRVEYIPLFIPLVS